jgi:dUTP pyrophosphatase
MCDNFKVFLISEFASEPVRATDGAAGYDLRASENTVILPQYRKLISTDLIISIPEGHYARIAPRSGLSVKEIDVGAGVCDFDYRGVLKVLLINNSNREFQVQVGDRIAQLILEKCSTPDVTIVKSKEELGYSKRGEGGFGSTGIQ